MIGMKLKNYMDENKIKRGKAAGDLGVSLQNLHQWCTGKRIPRPEYMKKIYHWSKRKVSPNDFYDLSDPGLLEGLPLFNGTGKHVQPNHIKAEGT